MKPSTNVAMMVKFVGGGSSGGEFRHEGSVESGIKFIAKQLLTNPLGLRIDISIARDMPEAIRATRRKNAVDSLDSMFEDDPELAAMLAEADKEITSESGEE